MPNEADLMIDLRVVNDFADNKKTAIFENLARCIGKIDRALDPVAKAKLFRQAHSGVAHGNDSPRPAHFLDNIAPIMRFDLLLHRSHDVGRAQVHFLPRCCAAGNQIRAHTMIVILSAAKNLRGVCSGSVETIARDVSLRQHDTAQRRGNARVSY